MEVWLIYSNWLLVIVPIITEHEIFKQQFTYLDEDFRIRQESPLNKITNLLNPAKTKLTLQQHVTAKYHMQNLNESK